MTTAYPSLEQARQLLTEAVLDRGQNLPRFDPLNIHPWLAMSLMQKAIRRGREDLALRASATLLKVSPDRFWRRICVTAYEDIGVAEWETVAIVTAALKGKRWRSQIGGEWVVASYLVERMCRTIKCRAADDLAVVCQWHSSLGALRPDFASRSIMNLLQSEIPSMELPASALALWYAIGTDRCQSPVLLKRRGLTNEAWDFLSNSNLPATAVEVAQVGFQKVNSILCPFALLLLTKAAETTNFVQPDNLPSEDIVGDIPCWAFDVHVREGNQAIGRFLRTESNTTRWLSLHVRSNERFRVLGSMLFRVESGMVDRRMHWEVGDALRHMADFETCGVAATKMQEGLRLLCHDLLLLHQIRQTVTARHH